MTLGSCFAVALLGAVTAVSGLALVRTRARLSGVLLTLGGATVVVGALTIRADPSTGRLLLVAASGLALAPALLAYPRPEWREPIDFALWVVVGAAGVMAAAAAGSDSVVGASGMLVALALVGHVLVLVDRADVDDRLAMLWASLAAGAAVIVSGHALFLVTSTAALGVLTPLLILLVPVALVVGIRWPRWVDVRALIVRAVVLGVAMIAYVSVFVGITSTLDLLGAHDLPVGTLAVLGALAATTFHPLQVVLRGVVDELLFGVRPDPLAAASQVAGRIGDDPTLALGAIREALVLPYASLWVDGQRVAESGTEVTHTRTLSLSLGEGAVGQMVVGLRSGDLRLSAGDERVLGIVAPLLAQTVRAQAMAADLAASRGLAIATIEDERRRLRRDLHDGLGPTLSGIAFTADAARNSLGDTASAEALLRRLRADAVDAIAEIRRLVYDMRPPALDELGLVPALRQWAREVRTGDGRALQVDVRTASDLPALPAAVEVAAYRIAVEALMNAARHSGAERADVSLAVSDGALTLDVRDEGRSTATWKPGVGMSSMQERAAEVGGSVTAGTGADGGRVLATLPLG